MANNLTRFNPFGDLSEFNNLRNFEDLFNRLPITSGLASRVEQPRMSIDVTETESAYTVKAEVPGASKEDVKVSVEDNIVSIRVEKTQEDVEKDGETVLRRERYHGVQSRRFSLANEIDSAAATAKCANGVLELVLPKKTNHQGAKTLDVQ